MKVDEEFYHWDPYNIHLSAISAGITNIGDLSRGVTMKREINAEAQGGDHCARTQDEFAACPAGHARGRRKGSEKRLLDYTALQGDGPISWSARQQVKSGQILARTPRQASAVQDITGGSAACAELFGGRAPKEAAELRSTASCALGAIKQRP